MSQDRIKAGLEAFIRSVLRRVDYFALYPAKVVAQNADKTLELQPDDTRLPAQSQVPIRLGIPGAQVSVSAGARVLLGFAGGQPDQPIATLWETATVTQIVIGGSDIRLGSSAAAEAVALASKVQAELDLLKGVFDGWAVVPNDGGSALKILLTGLTAAGWPHDTGSSRTKTEL